MGALDQDGSSDTNFMLEKQVQGVSDDPEMKDKDIINM